MTDAIYGWITGKEFCEDPGVQVYINSLCACGFEGQKIIFTCEMPSEFARKLNNKGFDIVWIPKEEVHTLYRDRHLAYYKTDIMCTNYRYIIQTDTRDTVFLKNPIDWIEHTQRKAKLFLVSEGFPHKVSPINIQNQTRYQQTLAAPFKKDFSSWPVINGGTVIGHGNIMCFYDLAIWLSGIHANGGDQCATNYVSQTLSLHPDVEILDPKLSNFCLTGEAINLGAIVPKNIYDYYLFHQWDRTRYKDEILKKWGDSC